MNEAGANQPMPLVHNGIMYLGNTGNMMQALDAATGELIWENQVGPNPSAASARCATSRSMATRSSWRPTTAASSRSTRAPARSRGTRRSPIRATASPTQRPDRRARQGDPGPARLRSLPREGALLSSAPTTPKPASSCGSSTPSRAPASPAAIPGARCPTWCAPAATPGLPAATIPISISPTGASRRRSRGCRPAAATRSPTRRSTPRRPWRCASRTARWRGTSSTCPVKSLDLDEVFEKVLVDIGPEQELFTIGKAGILWKIDRKTGQFLGYKQTVFQNVFDAKSIPRRGMPDLPPGHHRSEDRRVADGVPEHRGRAQLAGDDVSPAAGS